MPNRSPTPTSKTNDCLGPFDDLGGARGPNFGAFKEGSGGPGRLKKHILFSTSKRPLLCILGNCRPPGPPTLSWGAVAPQPPSPPLWVCRPQTRRFILGGLHTPPEEDLRDPCTTPKFYRPPKRTYFDFLIIL